MKNLKRVIAAVFLLLPSGTFALEPGGPGGAARLQEGDLVFIRSKSAQSPALEEVMGSSWTHVGIALLNNSSWFVAETAAASSLTPLSKFLDKSRGRDFLVKRFKPWSKRPDKKGLALLKEWLLANQGKKYDIYFEWSDTAFYCSEYAWKAYNSALPGHPVLSAPQKFSDLKLDGPLAKELIRKRYIAAGKRLNMDEPIVTPSALLNSGLLRSVTP